MHRALFLVIAVAIAVSFFRLGRATLFDVDEAVFAQATSEMVQSGDWITPTYNGINRYDKPILFYWLMAASYGVFGVNEFGARFPSAAAAFLLALAIFLFVRRVMDRRRAAYASLSAVLSLYFLVYSHAAITDMVLTLFITLSLFSFYLSVEGEGEGGRRKRAFVYGFYFFSALAFLTKGLIGILFPFGIAAVYAVVSGGPGGVRRVFSLKGAALFLAVSAPWYIAEYSANGMEFIGQFFIKHHFRRYLGVISGHRGPIYYYLPVLLLGLFPWVAFLPAGIRNALRRRKGPEAFAFVWFCFVVAFFSLSTTKLPNYTLPAVAAASVVIASGMADGGAKWQRVSNITLAALSALMCALFAVSGRYLSGYGVADVGWTLLLAGLMAVLVFSGLLAARAGRSLHGVTAGVAAIFLLVLSVKAVPMANGRLQGALYEYSLYARDNLPRGQRIVVRGINNPSILFYSGHKVVDSEERDNRAAPSRQGSHAIAITKDRYISSFEGEGFNLLKSRDGYALLERK
jgi:4-amino-4-deoxy-L-arabinose transferase-like glycosyltransferase